MAKVVHVLLLTHEFMYNVICLPQSCILSVTNIQQHEVHVPKTHR